LENGVARFMDEEGLPEFRKYENGVYIKVMSSKCFLT